MKSVRILRDETLCVGRRVSLIKRVLHVEGKELVKDVIDFGEAVAIVPITDDEQVIMLRQYRAAVNDWIYEIPAGRIEEGESIEEAARRELIEETGYEPGILRRVISVYTAPGYSNEVLHILVARKLRYVGAKPEAGEIIEVVKIPLNEALKFIIKEKIVDAKTVIALTLLQLIPHMLKR